MKTYYRNTFTALVLIFTAFLSYAESIGIIHTIESFPIAITDNKTTNLIFPYDIRSVDRGSKEVLVQKAKGTENILQLKAAQEHMKETNLTVITSDGKLYSFLLRYTANPKTLNYSFGIRDISEVAFSPGTSNESILKKYAEITAGKKKKIRGVKDKNNGVTFRLTGLFVKDNVMYYRFHIENASNLKYTIDQLRFFVRDRKKAKRTTYQEMEIPPLYMYKDTDKVEGQSGQTLVVALQKRTLPNKKQLSVQLMENYGGRHLELSIKNRKLMRATVL
ncbi:conjugative transposon protein TraN [Sinomicrobium weinanense]|uniref:Conjugative transposon protein TraN n=1 Tax=Sinomicrobium weinanense TaxID=2842200 RepID=A0A926Q153_9FLAO|nr:conjugative transposon protein TraN [Sinomicrobium weinanense]MBC9795353.1 conjugative transposon protein TraN [Sinomicrobium weinanense]MBU3122932.1 conjugative transposon protein TraN [Sinomicrobium weinanense]